MPIADPNKVLDKFGKLHRKLGGFDRPVTLLKFTNAVTDYHTVPTTYTEVITPTIPAIVKDQPDKSLMDSFPGGIGKDDKLFIFVADSLTPRLPLDTLSFRAENILSSSTGQNRGGIKYGNTTYTIERIVQKPIIGTVVARYIILGTAQKTVNS